MQVHPAPGPEEVNWQHLWLTWRERDLRSLLSWPLLIVVVVFPITLGTSAVAQLQYVLCPTTAATTTGSTVRRPALEPLSAGSTLHFKRGGCQLYCALGSGPLCMPLASGGTP